MKAVMQTDDIFLGAFALLRGGELRRVEVRGINGRRLAFFWIDGDDTRQVERDYYAGPALVNLLLLKSSVRRLKDAAFDAIREEERRSHASEDQPGADRYHQVAGRSRAGRR